MKIWFDYFLTYFKRKRKFLSFFFLICIVIGFTIYQTLPLILKERFSEGIVGTHQEHDLPEHVLNLISQSLVTIDKTGTPQPNLAEKWEVNKEATLYTIKLKKDLKWSDGTPLIASDIALAIPDVEMKVVDEGTLEFKIVDSFSPFLTLLRKPILKKGSMIGVGPYEIAVIKKDGPFIKQLNLKSKDKTLPELTIKFYPNEKIAKNALKLGEVQSLLGVNDLTDFSSNRSVSNLNKVNYQQLVTVFYNTADPVLSDENMRLALSYSAPVIANEIEAKTSLPSSSWAFNSATKDYLDNLEAAKASLKKVEKGKDSQIVLTATSSLQSVGEKVVESWKKAGINAVLRVESGIPQNFQALLITQTIPVDPDQYSLWHSTQKGTNISGVSSPRLDKDLEDGRKITDLEVRKQRYQDFQKVLMDESPATFLYFPKFNVLYLKKSESSLKKILDIQLRSFQ